jgi:transposase
MRGEAERQATLMLGLTPESFVPKNHPLRRIKPLADSALRRMSPLFNAVYAAGGRPSIPPEHLLKSSLLMAFHTIRSERQFCEQLRYNLLFKWFLDLNIEDEPFHPTTFTKNRERLLEADAARVFLKEVVQEARRRRLLSPDHFTVDGTLLEAWASHKSYRPRDEGPPRGGGRNREADFTGERRRRETHESTTDPEARLYRKGKQQGAQLCYLGHALTENRHGLIVDVELTQADGYAERLAALAMLRRSICAPATLGADRGYDTRDFVADVRALGVTPHIAQNERGRRSAIDGRTTRHRGYRQSQRRRKLVEEVFGWIKTVGAGGKLRYLGRARNKLWFELTAAAYNLTRLANIEAAAA